MTSKARFKYPVIAIITAFFSVAFLTSCHQKSNGVNSKNENSASDAPKNAGVSIAYVNMDTLEAQYIYFEESKKAFEKRQAAIESQLQADAQNLQNEYIHFQKKVQAGTMTQAEGEATQKKLGNMQQALEAKRQNLTSQLMADQEKFNEKVQNQLDSFLTQYNKDKHYDYIFSHVKNGGILLANPAYNITTDVVKGMNEAYEARKTQK